LPHRQTRSTRTQQDSKRSATDRSTRAGRCEDDASASGQACIDLIRRCPLGLKPCRLLALTGLSPAVLTETIELLCFPRAGEPQFGGERWWPAEIAVVTTAEGRRRLEAPDQEDERYDRLVNINTVLADMRARLGVPGLPPFPAVGITVPAFGAQDALDDTDTPEKLDLIGSALMREFKRMRDLDNASRAAPHGGGSVAPAAPVPVHVSVAGGRNGMTFLAAQVLQLYGRQEDRASQVLVSPEWAVLAASNHMDGRERDFYYRQDSDAVLLSDEIAAQLNLPRRDAEGRLVASPVHLSIIDLPWLRLGALLDAFDRAMLDQRDEPLGRLVAYVNNLLVLPTVYIDREKCLLEVAGTVLQADDPKLASFPGAIKVRWTTWAMLLWVDLDNLAWPVTAAEESRASGQSVCTVQMERLDNLKDLVGEKFDQFQLEKLGVQLRDYFAINAPTPEEVANTYKAAQRGMAALRNSVREELQNVVVRNSRAHPFLPRLLAIEADPRQRRVYDANTVTVRSNGRPFTDNITRRPWGLVNIHETLETSK